MKPCRLFYLMLISTLAVISIHSEIKAQSKLPEEVYLFDQDMKPARAETATYFLSLVKLGDSVWQWDTYRFKGPIIRMQTFSDHDGKVLNGPSYFYTESGDLDSIAQFKNGLRDGDFFHLETTTASGRNSLVWKTKYVYANDSLLSTKEVEPASAIDTAGDKESVYPGGLKKWGSYLTKTLRYPDRAMSLDIQGLVCALFTVDKTGKLGDIYLGRSVEYSLDREVQRVIRKSGDWIPGLKAGEVVKTWKLQPVNMQLR